MSRFVLSIVAAGLVMLPFAAGASDSDVEAQLRAMQERMAQMEDQLQAQTDQLDDANERLEAQTDLINRAKIDQDSQSGVAAFLDTLEIGGWIAGSWIYNFEDPDGENAPGFNNGNIAAYPFHPDANTFSLDQVWIEMSRPTSEENRAGFALDFLFGKTGDILNNGPFSPDGGRSGTDEDFHLYQAYIEYLAPVGPNGIQFQAGKMGTWIGAEVAGTIYNFNISRGNVYTLFQPITNVGIRASAEVGSGVEVGVGFVNGTRSDADVEFTNKEKAVVWKLAWSNDTFGAQFAGTYGEQSDALVPGATDNTRAGKHETILDLILSWDPNEKFSSYINFDWINVQNNIRAISDDVEGYGIAAAGRYAINERAGIALRGEWVDLDREALNNLRVWNITLTGDYNLTENLKLRAEWRYDNGRGMQNDDTNGNQAYPELFCSATKGCEAQGNPFGSADEDDQHTLGIEVIYTF